MTKFQRTIERLASVPVTLFCLALMMALVFIGTLAQASMGTFVAQKLFFNSFFVWISLAGLKIPVFPGGLTVGFIWLVNLLSAFAVRFQYQRKDIGALISHAGILLLLMGQGLTQITAQESRMAIEIGQTQNYIERARHLELALVMVSDPHADQIISIPAPLLNRRKIIRSSAMPFTIHVKNYFENARLNMGGAFGPASATHGIGQQISVQPLPITTRDDEENNVTAVIQIRAGESDLGTWLVSLSLHEPQSLIHEGREYQLSLRPKREYLPYTLTLKEFHHDRYPGTDIPKNFSSLVHIQNPQTNEERDALIYMNHPLRHRGLTFYQASFGKNDTLSVFQVVRNPVWLTPYISCSMVVIGLTIQFLLMLTGKSRRPI